MQASRGRELLRLYAGPTLNVVGERKNTHSCFTRKTLLLN
jgi:hypothetical protein